MNIINKFESCLPDIETILPELAEIIDADYQPGTFSKAEEVFCNSGNDREMWNLSGRSGIRFTALFEKFEGYFFVRIYGSGDIFNNAKAFLYKCYLAQGGNPGSQEKP